MKKRVCNSITRVVRFCLSAAGGAKEARRAVAATAEIAVGDTRRSSSGGTSGQRAGNAKEAAARAQRSSRDRVHKIQDAARCSSGEVTRSLGGS